MKIHKVLEIKISELKSDPLVQGIMLTGSIARGTETEHSDLDIIVLYDDNKVVEEVIDGVPVETHYNNAQSVMERFNNEPSSAYLYTYGKIIFDREGIIASLVSLAKRSLSDYQMDENMRLRLTHKLSALREKLSAAVSNGDELKINYLIHNNFKYIVEAVYLKNSLPVPPQGLLYEIYDKLERKPSEKWLKRLITLKGAEQAEFALACIEL